MKKQNMNDVQLVILMAGNATRLAPLTYALPKGLLTVNNKPGIYNMLYEFVNKGLKDITIVVSPSNHNIVKNFLNKAFENVKLNFVVQENPKGPLHAFELAEPYITQPTLLLLGDTSCETDLDFDQSWLGYMDITDNSHSRWCLIETNEKNVVLRQIDKPKETPNTNKALVGIYFFKNPKLLSEALKKQYDLKHNELQLSSAIDYYKEHEDFKALKINQWSDSGALGTYTQTIKKINSNDYDFQVDDFLKLTKQAKNEKSEKKIKDEINWLNKTSKLEISSILPRVFESKEKSYSMEYLDYTSLFEYFNFYPIAPMNLGYMFEQVLNSINFMQKQSLSGFEIKENLLDKTISFYTSTLTNALNILTEEIPNFNQITINGVGLSQVENIFKTSLERLQNSDNIKFGVCHNNLNFSNILYLQKISGIKFISPKGFESEIVGDTRLDYAWLKLNYGLRIEEIKNNMFLMEKTNNLEYNLTWLCKALPQNEFDDLMAKRIKLQDINLIAVVLAMSEINNLTINQKIAIIFAVIQMFEGENQ